PWTATVHALLRHLRAAGLEVPQPVALEPGTETSPGVEVVRRVDGAAGADAWPLQATEEGLRSVARLLRAVHDAAASFVPPPDAVWVFPARPGAATTNLHGDPGPGNLARCRRVPGGLLR